MTLKIVAAGIGSREIHQILEQYDSASIRSQIMSDFEGAQAVQRGDADVYFGACYSGQGGALAAAIAILGYTNTAMVGDPGRGVDSDKIAEAVSQGIKAFGMTHDQIEQAVPLLVEALLKNAS